MYTENQMWDLTRTPKHDVRLNRSQNVAKYCSFYYFCAHSSAILNTKLVFLCFLWFSFCYLISNIISDSKLPQSLLIHIWCLICMRSSISVQWDFSLSQVYLAGYRKNRKKQQQIKRISRDHSWLGKFWLHWNRTFKSLVPFISWDTLLGYLTVFNKC